MNNILLFSSTSEWTSGHDKRPAIEPFNSIITAATPLLILLTQIRNSIAMPDVTKLRLQIVSDMRLFEQHLTTEVKNERTILAARYCLCTAIDEAVLNTEWGPKSIWSGQSLLSLFYNETQGGERFYIILEHMLKDIPNNLNLIEFIYLLLSLGFQGKFFKEEENIREEIRNSVFYKLVELQGKIHHVAPDFKNKEFLNNDKINRLKIKNIFILLLSSILILITSTNYVAFEAVSKIRSEIDSIGRDSTFTVYRQLVAPYNKG